MVNLYDSYKQANIINYIPDSSAALMKAAEKRIEEYQAYEDKANEASFKLGEMKGVSIYSNPDKMYFDSKMAEAEEAISNVWSKPGSSPRTAYRDIMRIMSGLQGDRNMMNILKTAKNTEEFAGKVQDPELAEMYDNMSISYDTVGSGKPLMYPAAAKPNWEEERKAAEAIIKPRAMNADGTPNLKGDYFGMSQGMIDEFLAGDHPENMYRDKGYYHFYEYRAGGDKDLAKEMFLRDFAAQLKPSVTLSDLGKADEADRRKRTRDAAEEAAKNNRNTDPEKVSLITFMSDSYARFASDDFLHITKDNEVYGEVEKNGVKTRVDKTNEAIDILSKNPASVYSLMPKIKIKNGENKMVGMPVPAYMVNGLASTYLRRAKDSDGNTMLAITSNMSTSVSPALIQEGRSRRGSDVSLVTNSKASHYLSKAIVGMGASPVNNTGSMRVSYNLESGGMAMTVSDVGIGGSDNAVLYLNEMFKHYVNSMSPGEAKEKLKGRTINDNTIKNIRVGFYRGLRVEDAEDSAKSFRRANFIDIIKSIPGVNLSEAEEKAISIDINRLGFNDIYMITEFKGIHKGDKEKGTKKGDIIMSFGVRTPVAIDMYKPGESSDIGAYAGFVADKRGTSNPIHFTPEF